MEIKRTNKNYIINNICYLKDVNIFIKKLTYNYIQYLTI